MLGRALGDDPADRGRAGEIDPPHRRMVDQRADHFAGILGRVGDEVDHAVGEAGLVEGLDDQRVGARAYLGGLEDHRVAAGERHRDRAHAENDRRVPRRDAEDHPDRLAKRHGEAAGLVGRDDLAADLGGQRRRLADHAGGEHQVEPRPALGRADLGHHRRDERVGLGFQRGRGLVEQRAPGIGTRTPRPERPRPPHRPPRSLDRYQRRRLSCDLPGHRVSPLESAIRCDCFAGNRKVDQIIHWPSRRRDGSKIPEPVQISFAANYLEAQV